VTARKRVPTTQERRTHRALREALDELLQHVRIVRRTLPSMTPQELEHAQERLEWLADEVWRLSLGEEDLPA
jgi:hypothetical protein